MPDRIVNLDQENFYHLYNRGVNRGLIYFSERNYEYFLYKMGFQFQEKTIVLAYCLMPNHFHLLVQIKSLEFVHKSLQPFLISYTRSVNIDQNRIGPLFQGRYQANLICDDSNLLDCVKYIHLNPVKAGLVIAPQDWDFSSYRGYFSYKNSSFVNTSIVLKFFDSIDGFRDFSETEVENYQSKSIIDDY